MDRSGGKIKSCIGVIYFARHGLPSCRDPVTYHWVRVMIAAPAIQQGSKLHLLMTSACRYWPRSHIVDKLYLVAVERHFPTIREFTSLRRDPSSLIADRFHSRAKVYDRDDSPTSIRCLLTHRQTKCSAPTSLLILPIESGGIIWRGEQHAMQGSPDGCIFTNSSCQNFSAEFRLFGEN